tara:strand:- start:115 stop:549 length:435 start_codon:yes stop_codon:yes gene_type:complete
MPKNKNTRKNRIRTRKIQNKSKVKKSNVKKINILSDKLIKTKIQDLKKISVKGGLSLSFSELNNRYDLISKHCGFNKADIAKDVAQISGIESVDKKCKESLVVIWNLTYSKNEFIEEIKYLEAYLSNGIDEEIKERDNCTPKNN